MVTNMADGYTRMLNGLRIGVCMGKHASEHDASFFSFAVSFSILDCGRISFTSLTFSILPSLAAFSIAVDCD